MDKTIPFFMDIEKAPKLLMDALRTISRTNSPTMHIPAYSVAFFNCSFHVIPPFT